MSFPDPGQQAVLSDLTNALQTAMLLVSRLDATTAAQLADIRAAFASVNRAATAAHTLRAGKE